MLPTHFTDESDFLKCPDTGLWLLPPESAQSDLALAVDKLGELVAMQTKADVSTRVRSTGQKALSLLERTQVDTLGCFRGGLRGHQNPGKWAMELYGIEMKAPYQDNPDDADSLRLCGSSDCYNPRHYHLSYVRASVDHRQMNLNPNWYTVDENGEIVTIWGDTLPRVEESYRELLAFQRRNYPYVSADVSPLTPTPMSQILFHPTTGCWEAYNYETNTPNLRNPKNGYGRFYVREYKERFVDDEGTTHVRKRRGSGQAHVVLWLIYNQHRSITKEINHLCNYPRCCNPLHLEQITPEENREHGHLARSRIRLQEAEFPGTKGASLSIPERRRAIDVLRAA